MILKVRDGQGNEQEILAMRGQKGLKGDTGERGPKGDTGQGLTIKGYYGTATALQAAVTNPAGGDAYGVGTAAPYDIYIWDAVGSKWVNNGPLQGAKGEQGETGPQGAQGQQGPAGANGADGTDGRDGTTFTPSVSEAGVLSWTNDGGKANPAAVNIKGPKGDTGAKGEQGEPGTNGTQVIIAKSTAIPAVVDGAVLVVYEE